MATTTTDGVELELDDENELIDVERINASLTKLNNGYKANKASIDAAKAGSNTWLRTVVAGDALTYAAVTRDTNAAATSASVVWPDGTTGTWTATTLSTAFPGAVDAFTVTYGSGGSMKTVTQAAVTRNTTGAVTAQPALVVS